MSRTDTDEGFVVHAPIDKLGAPFRWLRHKLLDGILVGTPVVLTMQRHRTPLLNTIMKSVSFLGTEDFYTIMIATLIWIFDTRLGRLFCFLMSVGFYITGVLKTSLRLPRPPSPPVRPLEIAYDWALPSHHSLMGTIQPWYVWLYIQLHFQLTSLQLSLCFMLILFWSISVLFSRLYLGVHSPADILSGGFIGVLVLSLWKQVDDVVDYYISQQNIDVPLLVLAVYAFLIYIHPSADIGNPSLSDSCCVFGVTFGIILGRTQRMNFLGWPALLETLPSHTPFSTFLFLFLSRLVVGAICILVIRLISKKLLTIFFTTIFTLCKTQYYSSKAYRMSGAVPSRHFTSQFRLPPIEWNDKKSIKCEDDELSDNESSNSTESHDSALFSFWQSRSVGTENTLPWDIDIFIRVVLYPILSYSAVEVVPRVFILCNL